MTLVFMTLKKKKPLIIKSLLRSFLKKKKKRKKEKKRKSQCSVISCRSSPYHKEKETVHASPI